MIEQRDGTVVPTTIQPASLLPAAITVTVLIGNSDNKLPQVKWATFTDELQRMMNHICPEVHFVGYSPSQSIYQNAAIIAVLPVCDLPLLKQELKAMKQTYSQDSIALVIGTTEFL